MPTRSPRGAISRLLCMLSATAVFLVAACDDAAGDGMDACVTAPFPMLNGPPGGAATQTNLSAFCQSSACPSTEAAYRTRYTCHALLPDGGLEGVDGADAGLDGGLFRWWARLEGCERVQYYVLAPSWPRYFNFSLDGGALIGAAQADDLIRPAPGTSCDDSSYVAGIIGPTCLDASVQYCAREPGPN